MFILDFIIIWGYYKQMGLVLPQSQQEMSVIRFMQVLCEM